MTGHGEQLRAQVRVSLKYLPGGESEHDIRRGAVSPSHLEDTMSRSERLQKELSIADVCRSVSCAQLVARPLE
jgi:hypothetical protein